MHPLAKLARSYLFGRISGGEFRRELILGLADLQSDDKDALRRIAQGMVDAWDHGGEG